jgi:hypothetical protein
LLLLVCTRPSTSTADTRDWRKERMDRTKNGSDRMNSSSSRQRGARHDRSPAAATARPLVLASSAPLRQRSLMCQTHVRADSDTYELWPACWWARGAVEGRTPPATFRELGRG